MVKLIKQLQAPGAGVAVMTSALNLETKKAISPNTVNFVYGYRIVILVNSLWNCAFVFIVFCIDSVRTQITLAFIFKNLSDGKLNNKSKLIWRIQGL